MNRYYLEVTGTHLAYTVLINDIVIFSDRWQEAKSDGCPINQWLLPDQNLLQVNLGVGFGENETPSEVRAEIKVKEVALSEPGRPEKILAEINWSLGDESLTLPLNLQASFELDAFPKSRWQEGLSLSMDSLPVQELERETKRLFALLEEKRLEDLVQVMRMKSEEMAAAYGVDLGERLEDQKEFFQSLFEDPDWGMEPLNTESLFYQVEGFGRLVKVTNRQGLPALNSKEFGDGSCFGLKIYLSKIDGRWEVVR